MHRATLELGVDHADELISRSIPLAEEKALQKQERPRTRHRDSVFLGGGSSLQENQ